jgi:hypothetical protein
MKGKNSEINICERIILVPVSKKIILSSIVINFEKKYIKVKK